jgi:DNA-binding SARP family transcriptional activator/predicted ATPase
MSKEIPSQPWLRFHFLGGCEISLPDGPVHLETAKTRALLVYLALNPGPQPRHRLMGLLWAELPEANARRNLRRALWNLRHQLSSPALPPSILSDRETVCFNREVAHWSDVAAFETACSYLAPASPRPTPAFHRDQGRRAAELYSGEFLQGFYVGNAAAFEEWALAERERLRAMALRALQHLVAGHAARNETETALHYARRLLALEPWLEEAHAWLMRLLARSGRRAEALAQFEACKRVLAEELGVEPAQETQALYEQIRSGAFAIPASSLPAPTTPFVGRARELAEIAGLLSDPDCRLLTVTGLGGVGKTRLAREVAAQQIAAFVHGVHYVALSALGAAERLAAALAQSLDIPLVGTADPGAALLAYLREKQMLLVLDGFEHLLEGATLPAEILQAAPGVKILVTSRERLNLRGEWVCPLAGLECAPDGPVGDPASFDALRLFLQTARRVHLRFQVREGEDRHLARICNLVSGLPLAIELAAAWVRVLSLEEIAAESAQHLDFLATTTRDRPPRHRSIRAVFDHSWHLLSDKERDVFRKLSVFRGSFRAQEAGRVGGATLPILSALVDKSLLQRAASGRYQVHELLRQYAHDQLAQIPGEPALVRDLHCQVYAASVVHYHHALKRGPQHRIVMSFAADMEDILAAWRWAVQQRNLEAVAGMWRGLADYYQLRSSFREGETLFREALEALGWPSDQARAGPGTLLSWELLSVQAMFALYLGRFPQARASLERCVALFARHGVAERVAHCQFFLGEIARFQGDHHAAGECYRQSLANYQQLGDRPAVGFCLNGLGLVSSALGELAPARSCFQASLAAFAETGHEMGQAIASINLADLLAKLGDHAAAREILDEGYTLCQKLGHRWGMAVCLRNLGDIARLEARTGDARAVYQQGLEILQGIGQRQASAGCLIKLGEVCTDLGDYTAARQHLHRALSITAELQDQAQMVAAAGALALLLAKEEDGEKALELALLVERHPARMPAAQDQVRQLAAELAHQLPGETFQRIQRRSNARTLEDLLAESAS